MIGKRDVERWNPGCRKTYTGRFVEVSGDLGCRRMANPKEKCTESHMEAYCLTT